MRTRGRACVALGLGLVSFGVSLGPDSFVPAAHANLAQHFPTEAPLRDMPSGAAIANLDPPTCRAILRANGVSFSRYRGDHDEAITGHGMLLGGPLNGVRFEHAGRSEMHSVLDCRLALALLAWTPVLREFGVTRVQHMSTFRPNAHVAGTSRVSGHASALAIDFRYLEFADGTRLDVLTDWTSRERGAPPCTHPPDELGPSAVLRRVVCRAIEADLFQVVVSPHHNDAHNNHVHLEVRPEVTWRSIQ
ncbi:MAG: extensin family protein [Polyangiales bacterium]|nr:extensin family protein [Myxococcales bacterium]MCB9661102.1 extensin family protein [Sandaracinaceae bacterium]